MIHYLAQFLFDPRTESNLTLLADPGHVLAKVCRDHSTNMSSNILEDVVTSLMEIVDTNGSFRTLFLSSTTTTHYTDFVMNSRSV